MPLRRLSRPSPSPSPYLYPTPYTQVSVIYSCRSDDALLITELSAMCRERSLARCTVLLTAASQTAAVPFPHVADVDVAAAFSRLEDAQCLHARLSADLLQVTLTLTLTLSLTVTLTVTSTLTPGSLWTCCRQSWPGCRGRSVSLCPDPRASMLRARPCSRRSTPA